MSGNVEELQSRLKDAKLRLDFARNYLKEVQADSMGGPDGHFAYHYAIRAETEALREYARILRELHRVAGDGPAAKGA
jgi:hypothetical protein